MDVVIRSRHVETTSGVAPASIHIRDGRIAEVAAWDALPSGCPLRDFGDAMVMPGLVDTHVHINEPGRTEWEGFETATRAAAAGGVTTLVEMPLNSIPATTTVAGLAAKREAARGKCAVDTFFWGGVVPGNTGELRGLYRDGVLGFKCFLAPSGVEEFPCVSEADLREAMPVLTGLGAVLLVHAELAGSLRPVAGDPRQYASYLASRPPAAEHEAIALMIRLCREFGTRVHIVHLSSADALPMLREARAEGLPVTVETCPHYLTFAAEEIPDGATELKCAPPIRGRDNREKLWAALLDGTIDLIASDHSPCPPSMKRGDFAGAWGGIASLQHGLPAVWTGMRRRGIGLEKLAGWMCGAPARLAGLSSRKGRIAAGFDADLVVWNPEARAATGTLHYRHKLTPYSGVELYGAVEATFLCGNLVPGCSSAS
ncbi:MAG: allantoinase AllB [Acidobacteria bacterium]|nr:allantoinase AllB [Acidobacteriota bacterium]